MSDLDYARTAAAAQCRRRKAAQLARWCYGRGIGPGVLLQPPQVLRVAARRARVNPPGQGGSGGRSPTWELVAELLQARARWDRAHGGQPPEHVRCIPCAVREHPCPHCAASRASASAPAAIPPPVERHPATTCPGCHLPVDGALLMAGIALHPCCERLPQAGP